MKLDTNNQGYLLGVALIVFGTLVLLANLGIIGSAENWLAGALFAAGGALLIRIYAGRENRFWALIVGSVLFGLAGAAISDGPLSGSYFLGAIGIGFGLIYYRHRRHWWALIPGGVLLSLAIVAGIDGLFPRIDPGPVLFLGLAATFAALYLLPEGGKRWAAYPALAAVVIALFAFSFGGGWLFPLVLIGIGLYLFNRQSNRPLETEVARATVQVGSSEPAQPAAVSDPAPTEPAPVSDAAPFEPDTRMAEQLADAAGREIEAGLDEGKKS